MDSFKLRSGALIFFLRLFSLTLATNMFCSESIAEENWFGYDAIVDELSQQTRSKAPKTKLSSEQPDILFHAGIGLTSSYVGLDQGATGAQGSFGRGFEVNLGIDLFTPRWIAEGSVRNYRFDQINQQNELRLIEFDLKLIHTDFLSKNIKYRLGGGLSARYLDFRRNQGDSRGEQQFNSPASILMVGFSTDLAPGLTLGSDLSYRQTLVSENIENSSVALGLRLDTHF